MTWRAPGASRAQRGIAAIELALLLPFFVAALAFPLFLGRLFWHYTAVQRAAQDAAHYVASIPLSEMSNPALAPAAVAVASDIGRAELSELSPGLYAYQMLVSCDGGSICGGLTVPTTLQVDIILQMDDVLFFSVTGLSVPLHVRIVSPYFGK